jgi:acyl carrier protein
MSAAATLPADIESRALACFSSVFPDVPEDQLPTVSQASLARWDSIAHVTLLAALSEEFRLEPDFEGWQEVSSFALALDFVRRRHATG